MACGKIVIGMCTFGRVDQLKDALGSLSQIILPDDVSVEFVLVDNNPDGFLNIFLMLIGKILSSHVTIFMKNAVAYLMQETLY